MPREADTVAFADEMMVVLCHPRLWVSLGCQRRFFDQHVELLLPQYWMCMLCGCQCVSWDLSLVP